jgi:lipopolysaccharide transport system ATP-binding protein
MKDVSQNDGRTVLFVSHNLGAVASLCQKGLLLSNGTMVYHGEVEDALSKYAKLNKSVYSSIDQVRIDGPLRKSIYFKNILINGADPYKEGVQITPDSEILIEIHSSSTESDSFRLIMGLIKEGVRILSLHDTESYVHTNGDFISKFKLPASFLRPGIYSVGIGTHSSKEEWSWSENVFEFDIIEKYDQINERRNFGLVNVKPLSFSERIIG